MALLILGDLRANDSMDNFFWKTFHYIFFPSKYIAYYFFKDSISIYYNFVNMFFFLFSPNRLHHLYPIGIVCSLITFALCLYLCNVFLVHRVYYLCLFFPLYKALRISSLFISYVLLIFTFFFFLSFSSPSSAKWVGSDKDDGWKIRKKDIYRIIVNRNTIWEKQKIRSKFLRKKILKGDFYIEIIHLFMPLCRNKKKEFIISLKFILLHHILISL